MGNVQLLQNAGESVCVQTDGMETYWLCAFISGVYFEAPLNANEVCFYTSTSFCESILISIYLSPVFYLHVIC